MPLTLSQLSSSVCSLLIVQISYSLPELMIIIVATFQGNSDLALGTVLGSSSLNILVIQGRCSLSYSSGLLSFVLLHHMESYYRNA